ncbi:MAG: hypothetical protein JNK77_11260 [Saprospiraceae bacterium]|nr:hypothetical protein [Saprospiraceae bacterium]
MSKQVYLLLACGLFVATNNNAQSLRYRPMAEIQAGVGLVPTYFKDKANAAVLPMSVQAAWRFKSIYSLGLAAGYSETNFQIQAAYDDLPVRLHNTYQMAALRGAVHTRHSDRWEAYGGVALGIQRTQIDLISGDVSKIGKHRRMPASATKLYYSGFVGGRFHLTRSVGVFGEIGWGASLLTTGLTYRVKKTGKCGGK